MSTYEKPTVNLWVFLLILLYYKVLFIKKHNSMINNLVKKIIQNTTLVFLMIFPIFFISQNILALVPLKTVSAVVLGSLMFFVILISKIKSDTFHTTKNLFVWSIFAFIISMVCSTIFSNATHISLMGRQINMYSLLSTISFFMLAYGIFVFFENKIEKKKLTLAVFISTILVSVIHLLFITLPFLPSLGFFNANVVNTIGGLSHFALFSVFTVISSILTLHFLNSHKLYKILGYVGIVSGLAVLSILNLWTMFVVLAFFCLILIVAQVVVFKTETEGEKKVPYPALAALIFSVIFVLVGAKVGILLNSTFKMQSLEVRPNITNTLGITKDVLIHEPFMNKLFGVGPDRFDVAWLQYRPIEMNNTQFWDTDFRLGYSFISSIGTTQGIVGLLAILLFVFLSFVYVAKVYRRINSYNSHNFIYVYAATGFLFFLVTLLISNPSIVLFTLFFVFLGLFVRVLSDLELISFKEKSITYNPRTSFGYILIVVFLLIGTVYVAYTHITQYTSSIIFANARKEFGKNQDVAQTFTKITQAQFFFNTDTYNLALIDLALFEMNKTLQDTTLTQEQASERFGQILQSMILINQQIISFDQKSYANHLFVLNVYKNLIAIGVQDASVQAFKVIDKIATFTPDNPTLALEKAKVAVLSKDLEGAKKYTQEALTLKSNYIQAINFLNQLNVQQQPPAPISEELSEEAQVTEATEANAEEGTE